MKNSSQFWGVVFWGCVLAVSGCQIRPVPPPVPQVFLLSHAFENYQSAGRILLATTEQKYAGELEFGLSQDFELRLQIFTPILGTLVYEIRANPNQFMVLDFQNQEYLLAENIPAIREQWLGMDLSLEELSWAVSGRMPQMRYEQLQGRFFSKKRLQFFKDGAEFLVFLGDNGIMQKMTKNFSGIQEYQVTIQDYQTVASQIYPKTIQVAHLQNRERILFVMNEIEPQVVQRPPLLFAPAEGMTPYTHPQ